ncbi:MAG: class I SAM-dependent methyltransferase, partial [Holophagae bacterium]|nr:class I SAM-dependent methyltransferase [Holophagae bacterium]
MIKDKVCNLCGSNSFEELVLGEPLEKTGNNVICLKCGLIFHNPMMSAQQMEDFYSRQYSGEYSASETISRELAHVRLAFLQKHLDPESISPVLEIGCAQGEFLSELAALDVDCRGVEPAEAMVKFGVETYGVDISEGVYEHLPESPDTYGMISLFHVLEHVFDPLTTLQRIGRELRPGGYLFLEVPTLGDCQLAMVFKNIHPTTFVRATLEAMLSVAGFQSVKVDEKGYHLRVLAVASPPAASIDFPEVHGIRQRVFSYLSKRRAVIDDML